MLIRGLGGLAILILLVGLGLRLSGPNTCVERVEAATRSAWLTAWGELEQLTAAAGGVVPSTRSLQASERGARLAWTLEQTVRDAFDAAELRAPSASQARIWLRDFVAVFAAARAAPSPPSAGALLQLERLDVREDSVLLRVLAEAGEARFELELSVGCEDGHPLHVEPRRVGS